MIKETIKNLIELNSNNEEADARIKSIYKQASEGEKQKIDSILISLTGLSLDNIIFNLTEEE